MHLKESKWSVESKHRRCNGEKTSFNEQREIVSDRITLSSSGDTNRQDGVEERELVAGADIVDGRLAPRLADVLTGADRSRTHRCSESNNHRPKSL